MFGTTKEEEFHAAIEAFASQFDLTLTLVKLNSFLVSTFHTAAGPPRSDSFALLSEPCEIQIGYIERDKIEADVILLDPDRTAFDAQEYLLMHFVHGVWEIAGPI